MKVLLIVDVQNDFCPGGNLAVTEGDKIIPTINMLINQGDYDCIVASKDWHPEYHCSFIDWPVHCVQNTFGAELRADLNASMIDKIIHKGVNQDVDSYSAFFDNAKIESTGLKEYLTELASSRGERLEDCEIHVVGLALDYCVKFSALDAAQLGLTTSVIYDATKAVNRDPGDLANSVLSDEEKALQELGLAGVAILTSSEVLIPKNIRQYDINDKKVGMAY